MIPFVGFPKIARYSRDCVITEKIDGTNAQVWIPTDEERAAMPEKWRVLPFIVGSRTRWLYPPGDNHGFSAWAYANQSCLLELGPGHHFGEWWGQGIQRKYGLTEKRFSLFNVSRWTAERPACCGVVPLLWEGEFGTACPGETINDVLDVLRSLGSLAAPGFMFPEGIVIYHIASGVSFKKTLEHDEKPKGITHDPI